MKKEENNSIMIDLNKVQNMLEWFKIKLFLNNISEKSKNRIVKRGEVYICNFGIGIGSEIQKERPCVILQNNIRNLKSGNVIVAPITHTLKEVPCIAPIVSQYNEDDSIILDGCVNLSLIQTVSKARLGNYITKLSNIDIKNINKAIFDSMGLMGFIKELENKILKKNEYICELKQNRNDLFDKLETLYLLAGVSNFYELSELIKGINK